jgi:ApbE superfamily uncharacterized protein (UPF0280 family)
MSYRGDGRTARVLCALQGGTDLEYFEISLGSRRLEVGVRREDLSPELRERAREIALAAGNEIEAHIAGDPAFATSSEPRPVRRVAPPIIRAMAEAAARCGVGPMTAAAGAVAEWIGREIARISPDVVVGSDDALYLESRRDRLVGVFAPDSLLAGRFDLEIAANDARRGLGICVFQDRGGTPAPGGDPMGVVIVVAHSAPLCGAVAAATGGRVSGKDDLEAAVTYACSVPGVVGAVALSGRNLAAKGRLILRPLLRPSTGEA